MVNAKFYGPKDNTYERVYYLIDEILYRKRDVEVSHSDGRVDFYVYERGEMNYVGSVFRD